jgi:GTP-dependent phosphoenolpyruvate carboxykinase
MAYQQYNDPAKLLLDICQPKWGEMTPEEIDDLLSEMSQLGLEMNQDKNFKHDYTVATKEMYMSYLRQQKEGNYVPPLFRDLDKEIRARVEEHHQSAAQTEALIPEYNTYTSDSLAIVHEKRAKLAKLRANITQKNMNKIITPNQRK